MNSVPVRDPFGIGNKESSQQLNPEFKLKYLEDKISEDSNSNVCYSSFR
jgi:hypothetical protein